MSKDIFDFLYNEELPIKCLAELYTPPKHFEYGVRYAVANIPKESGSDGQDCVIYEERWPARFFTLVVKDTANSVGEIEQGFTMSTGSGDEMGELIAEIAIAISQGMLGLRK
jgi:hypothetical protein